ncbi:hypothetical protein RvY_17594 [Ramazzottius varieornatus]|uniref:Uncharacterized protein n=1 Tax=Ramazzottius varieornatus TaxID=947166 RepID=A0A1D1W3E7_RAMVA|nr:hypothetical protein RvY_17594 [Ramazzottius varieornatus]
MDPSDKIGASLQSAFEKQDFYEAHQIYKSINFRLLRQKKYQQLADLLSEGCLTFLRLNLNQSGIDLARMYAEVLEKGNLPVTQEITGTIGRIYKAIPADLPNDRGLLLNLVTSWSQKRNPETKAGHTAIHAEIARILFDEKNYELALYHAVRALDPASCLRTLQALKTSEDEKNHGREKDEHGDVEVPEEPADRKLLAIAVMEFLTLQKLDVAKRLFTLYISEHPDAEVRTKLYNFRILALLSALLSLCSKSGNATEEEYRPVQAAITEIFEPDQRVDKLLTRIGQIYLGIALPSSSGPLQGLLAGMFKKEAPSTSSSQDTLTSSADSKMKENLQADLDFD